MFKMIVLQSRHLFGPARVFDPEPLSFFCCIEGDIPTCNFATRDTSYKMAVPSAFINLFEFCFFWRILLMSRTQKYKFLINYEFLENLWNIMGVSIFNYKNLNNWEEICHYLFFEKREAEKHVLDQLFLFY